MDYFTLTSHTYSGDSTHTIEFMAFPAGERHVRLPDLRPYERAFGWTLRAALYSPSDIMDLLLVVDALRRMVGKHAPLTLELPYLPYARQDRVALLGEPLSLKVFCDLINSLDLTRVVIYDPHSDVAAALLNNVTVVPVLEMVEQVLTECFCFEEGFVFVAPDEGARKKVEALAERWEAPAVYCQKSRDPRTGVLSQPVVPSEIPERMPLLVIDDICDGGGTAVGLAKALRQKTDQPLCLYVTQGLFTKGLQPLRDAGYSKIFCYNCKDPELRSQLDFVGAD